MMKRYTICLLALFIAASACEKKEGSEAPTNTTAETSTTETVANELKGDLTKEKAQSFVELWFDAYSQRDWDKLEPAFRADAEIVIDEGLLTNRVSPAVWKSQRSRDSKQKGFTVTPRVTEFGTFEGGAFIRAVAMSRSDDRKLPEETWEFLIRDEAGQNRVALVMQRDDRSPSDSAPPRSAGTVVIDGAMLLEAQPTTDAERGYRTLVNQEGLAELWVDESKLPLEWQRMKGKSVELIGRDGDRCESVVTGFRYQTRLELADWLQQALAPAIDGKLTAREAGELVWNMAGRRGRALVATLDPKSLESCVNPILGRISDGEELQTYRIEETREEDRVAMERFDQLKNAAAIQEEYARLGDETPWYLVGEEPTVKVFSNGTRTFVVASATAGSSCDDFVAGSFAIWEIKRDNWSLLTPENHIQGAFEPFLVADVNNDGSPEFYGEGVVVRESEGALRIVEDVRPVSFKGGC